MPLGVIRCRYEIAAGSLRPVRGSQLFAMATHYGARERIESRYPPYGTRIRVGRVPGTNVREQVNQRARDRWRRQGDNLVRSIRWATAHNYNLARTWPNICAEGITHMNYVMSANSSPPTPPHRIAILMSPEVRFLQCRVCHLTYTFPDGLKFGAVAKQFDSHSCVSPTRKTAWQTDRRFIVLRYEGKVPVLASCDKCERKFFTPTKLLHETVGAEEYLGRKFDVHECAQPKR